MHNLLKFLHQNLKDSVSFLQVKHSFLLLNLDQKVQRFINQQYIYFSIIRLNKRIVNQLQLNARDRYLNFIKDFPKMESVAKNYHVASYLGITE